MGNMQSQLLLNEIEREGNNFMQGFDWNNYKLLLSIWAIKLCLYFSQQFSLRKGRDSYTADKLICLSLIKSMSPDIEIDSFKAIKDLISADTLKTMQLLGFNYKAAIGEPLTKALCRSN